MDDAGLNIEHGFRVPFQFPCEVFLVDGAPVKDCIDATFKAHIKLMSVSSSRSVPAEEGSARCAVCRWPEANKG